MLECPRDFSDLLKFEVTAISAIDEEHMLTERKARAHVFEAKLGLNTSNDHFDDRLRPGVPDVEFIIDDFDTLVKDQQEGFQWWWVREEANAAFEDITYSGIVDLFPMTIYVPQYVFDNGLKAHLSISGSSDMIIYPAVSSAADRREFLKDADTGENQRSQASAGVLIEQSPNEVPILRGDEEVEFVAKATDILLGRQQCNLTLWVENGQYKYIPADSWRITFKDPELYWAFYSARNKAAGTLGYRVENRRVVSSEFYHMGSQSLAGYSHRDPAKSKYLVMLHGYNNTEDDARIRFNEFWKRVFWHGFRGQFVGVTWHGDVGGIFSPVNFDPSTRNALQTSTTLMLFLHGHVRNWAGGVENVDVLAHSLGNLVVWDAMRQYQTTGQGRGNPLFRNLISVEAAVWPETFWDEEKISYQSEPNPAYNITYTADDLKEHSWSFWFNQAAQPAGTSLGGQLHHSYVPDDDILFRGMRANDIWKRGLGIGGIPPYHLNRWVLQGPPHSPEWRAPEGKKQSHPAWGPGRRSRTVQNRLHDKVPTLMLQGHRRPYYGFSDLNLPIGTVEHPLPAENENATDGLGWRSKKHSDFAVGESGNANADMWFPIIWDWYEQFIQPAIHINEE